MTLLVHVTLVISEKSIVVAPDLGKCASRCRNFVSPGNSNQGRKLLEDS